jgi:hypothetical protein
MCPATTRPAFRSLPSDAGRTVSVVGVGAWQNGAHPLGAAVPDENNYRPDGESQNHRKGIATLAD